MELDQDLLFFFAALGAFNSLLLGSYILFNRKRHPTSYAFLGLLLLEHGVRAGFSCLYYFDDAPREFIKLGLSAHLLIGPTLYYFVRFRLNEELSKVREASFHLLFLSGILVALGFIFEFKVWDYTFRYAIHSLLSLYLAFTGLALVPVFKTLVKKTWKELEIGEKESLIVYLTVLLICLGFVVSLYTNYILGPVVFSFLLYGAVYLFFRMEKDSSKNLSYRKKLDTDEVERVAQRLEALMKEEKMYRDANLTLEKLAKKLSVSKYFLSQMLNDNLNKSYHELITEYRIEDASELLRTSEHLTLEAIAYDIGFNSKSSFFSAFKKLKGTTPSKFRGQEKV